MSNPMELFTPFLDTTYNIPEEDDRVKTYLGDNFSKFADVINDKRIGLFVQASENLNGEKWFYISPKITRNGYQAIVHIPSYPNAGTMTFSINSLDPNLLYPIKDVNPEFVVTQVWGSASRPCTTVGANDGDYFSFFSEGNSNISFTMSDTEIIVTTTSDMTAYSGFIIVQYLRNGV